MERHVENKIVVVTGAAQGLGLNIADKFLQNGAKIVIQLDVDEIEGNKAASELNNKYGEGRAVFIKCNVINDLEKVSCEIISAYKTVDVLVNNAGWYREESIKDTMALNATAVIEWSMKFFEHMRIDEGGKGGTILNMASTYGFRIEPYAPFYTASKFAVMAFTKSKGHEMTFAKTGVRMLVICPGVTRTRLLQTTFDEAAMEYLKTSLWQDPDAVGNAAVEIFKTADSGTAWLIEGGNPIEKV